MFLKAPQKTSFILSKGTKFCNVQIKNPYLGPSQGNIVDKGQMSPSECAVTCGHEGALAINTDVETETQCQCVMHKVDLDEFNLQLKTTMLKVDEVNCKWESGDDRMELATVDINHQVNVSKLS